MLEARKDLLKALELNKQPIPQGYTNAENTNLKNQAIALLHIAWSYAIERDTGQADHYFKLWQEMNSIDHTGVLKVAEEVEKEIEICKRQDFVVPANVDDLSYKEHQKKLHAFLVKKARERTTDKEQQAKLLNISRQTLHLWEKELGLK